MKVAVGMAGERWRQAKHATAKRRVLSDTVVTSLRFISHAISAIVISKGLHG